MISEKIHQFIVATQKLDRLQEFLTTSGNTNTAEIKHRFGMLRKAIEACINKLSLRIEKLRERYALDVLRAVENDHRSDVTPMSDTVPIGKSFEFVEALCKALGWERGLNVKLVHQKLGISVATLNRWKSSKSMLPITKINELLNKLRTVKVNGKKIPQEAVDHVYETYLDARRSLNIQ